MPVMRKLAILFITALLCLPALAQEVETVTGYDCECFIDGVSFNQGTLPASGGNATWQVDAASLSQGMHHVQMRLVQHLSSGISATAVYESLCYRIGDAASHEVTATCRIDGQVYKTATVPTNGAWTTWTVNLNDIAEGLHHVNVTIADKDRDGIVSTTSYDAMCYRPASGESHEITGTCYVDGQVFKTSSLPADGTTQTWVLDWSELPVGLHQVRIDIADKDKEGIVRTSRYQAICYRIDSGESHVVNASFYVDGNLIKQEAVRTDGEVQTIMLNLSNLHEGTYPIRVEIADKDSWGFVTIDIYESEFYTMGYEIYDVNGDGSINIGDISALVDAILQGEFTETSDLNGDGVINISDINMLIAFILNS